MKDKTRPENLLASVGATEAREKFAELMGRVAYAKERILLTRNGQDVGVLIPMEDYERLVHENAPPPEEGTVPPPLES